MLFQRSLPRVGLSVALPGAFAGVQWYGRGPHEVNQFTFVSQM